MRAYLAIPSLKNDPGFISRLRQCVDDIVIHASDTRPSKEELCSIVRDYELLICGVFELLDEDVASCADRLKLIASLSIGLDHIATDAFSALGVTILNTPSANAISVAEHAWALMLASAKRLKECDAAVRNGTGRRGLTRRPYELWNKTLGIIGAGQIAWRVANYARAFEMNIKIWTFHPDAHRQFLTIGAEFAESLEQLFADSDLITIHLRLSDKSRDLVTSSALSHSCAGRLRTLVNTSRAEIIEEGALRQLRRDGQYVDACLDVSREAEATNLPPNTTFLSPHIAGLSEESTQRMRTELAHSIKDWMRDE